MGAAAPRVNARPHLFQSLAKPLMLIDLHSAPAATLWL
jgi:hypothetical protein